MAVNTATTIFNLEDYRDVKTRILECGRRTLHVESTVESGCPVCGVIATRRHSKRRQRLRDIPVARPAEVVWIKVRYFCDEQLCPRRTSCETTVHVPARARSTRSLHAALVAAVVSSGCAVTEAAAAGVSWWLVQEALTTAATKLPDVDALRPRMLGLLHL